MVVQPGDRDFDIASGQFTILMYGGNLSFAVEGEQEAKLFWAFRALKRNSFERPKCLRRPKALSEFVASIRTTFV